MGIRNFGCRSSIGNSNWVNMSKNEPSYYPNLHRKILNAKQHTSTLKQTRNISDLPTKPATFTTKQKTQVIKSDINSTHLLNNLSLHFLFFFPHLIRSYFLKARLCFFPIIIIITFILFLSLLLKVLLIIISIITIFLLPLLLLLNYWFLKGNSRHSQ